MSVRSGQSITTEFTTRNGTTLARSVADSLPTGTLYVNGTADAATVTVTSQGSGLYKAAFTLPTLAIGDVVSLIIVATVNSVTDQAKVWEDSKDVLLDSSGDVTFNNTSIATVATLTNLPAIPANWLTAAGIAASALNGKGDWNVGKTGYTLTQAFPTNFAALGITAGGKVSGVVLVDTTTVNTDMRGTDNAALASQIPANFTAATFASAGVFSVGALANAPTGGGGGGDVNVVSVNGTTFGGPYVPVDVQTILGVASVGTAGYVGIDWGAIVGQGTTQDLANTTISAGQVAVVSGVVSAQLADGVVHGGSTALLYLQQINVQNSTGSPLVLYSASAGSAAIDLLGGDGAPAISAVAGAGGHDVSLGGDGRIWDGVNDRPVQVLSDRVMLTGTLPDQSASPGPYNVVLPSGPAGTDVLLGSRLRITAGSGQDQERTIVSWNGTTKVAGLDRTFAVAVAQNDSFAVLYDNAPQMSADGANVAASVFDFQPQALAQLFTTDSTKVYADAVTGSVVKEIAANAGGGGGGSDPWATAQPGTYGAGTFGGLVAADLPAILGKLNAAGLVITSVSTVPADGGPIRLIAGDDYAASEGLTLSWNSNSTIDYAGATISLDFYASTALDAAVSLSKPGSVTGSVGAWLFSVSLTAADTALIMATALRRKYALRALLANGHRTTPIEGEAIVTN